MCRAPQAVSVPAHIGVLEGGLRLGPGLGRAVESFQWLVMEQEKELDCVERTEAGSRHF